jgi:glycosyltransferase involved in cell wall biosynthesis
MRVLQLIDSLEAGGAERMATSLANELANTMDRSFLCATRKEGILKETIKDNVDYYFLKRRSSLDFLALLKLRKIIRVNNIDVVHAHTTSYFFGTLIKLIYPKILLIWHEHQGNRILSTKIQNKILYLCSFFFEKIITVNEELRSWCFKNLATKDVVYLSNFIAIDDYSNKNDENSKTVICLANLKVPKNHLNLLSAFNKVHKLFPDWKLLLVGKDFEDDYSRNIKSFIAKNKLTNVVILKGVSGKVKELLSLASIGVLSSSNEGLPMALLEYGAAQLAVVCTKVGQCEEVINNFGKCISANNSVELAEAIIFYIEHPAEKNKDAQNYKNHILKNYSIENIVPKLLSLYNTCK